MKKRINRQLSYINPPVFHAVSASFHPGDKASAHSCEDLRTRVARPSHPGGTTTSSYQKHVRTKNRTGKDKVFHPQKSGKKHPSYNHFNNAE